MPNQTLRFLWMTRSVILASIVLFVTFGCGGYRFELTKDKRIPPLLMDVPSLNLLVGERRKVLTVVGSPSQWGYAPGFVSSNPEVVRVVYGGAPGTFGAADIWLEGVAPGEARIALSNAWQRERATWDSATRSEEFVAAHDSFVVHCVPAR
jgi:hypothetical protein